MRIVNFLFAGVLALAITGCSCRAKKAGDLENTDNIDRVAAGDILKDVNFGFDSYALDSSAKGILNANASWLKANPTSKVQIEGHCDERGTNEYNMVLGANRAKSTYDYLRSQGIETARMSSVSYGEELPLDPSHNEGAWAKNRRAHFNLDAK
jgi:peptidoglycan-associated lipoprotein